MRILLVFLAACSVSDPPVFDGPDSGPPPPTGPVQWVEDGEYELEWAGEPPAAFATCDELHVLAVGETAVEFAGPECALEFTVAWRGNCLCTPDWCVCPNVGSLYAEIGGVPVRAYRQ